VLRCRRRHVGGSGGGGGGVQTSTGSRPRRCG
jgi:hypothetical protein